MSPGASIVTALSARRNFAPFEPGRSLYHAAGWRHRVRATGARRVAFEALGMPLSPANGDDATEGIWDEFTDALSGRGEAPLKIPRL